MAGVPRRRSADVRRAEYVFALSSPDRMSFRSAVHKTLAGHTTVQEPNMQRENDTPGKRNLAGAEIGFGA
jgi:hypothetical protein